MICTAVPTVRNGETTANAESSNENKLFHGHMFVLSQTFGQNKNMAAKRGPKGPMTDNHKAALAVGRAESKVVRDYLEALRTNKPKRGRRRTSGSIAARLSAIDAEMLSADPLSELKLVQERMNLQEELENMGSPVDVEALEKEFVSVAGAYSQRQGISYAAWRQVGVEPSVLSKAGISRGAA